MSYLKNQHPCGFLAIVDLCEIDRRAPAAFSSHFRDGI
jgi:hypothetical protein